MREEMVQEPALLRVRCLLGSPALTLQYALGEDWLSTCPPCLSVLGWNYLLCLPYASALFFFPLIFLRQVNLDEI